MNETIAGMSPAELQKATIYLLRFGNFTISKMGRRQRDLQRYYQLTTMNSYDLNTL